MITILEGSTFCIADDAGDVGDGLTGLFADDTRFVSRLALTLDGRTPLLLGADRVEYFNAAHYLRNAATDLLPRDTVSIARERFIGKGLAERLRVRNEGAVPISFSLCVAIEADFVDVITLKGHEYALSAGEPTPALPPPQAPALVDEQTLVLADPSSELVTWVVSSRDLELSGSLLRFALELDQGQDWELVLELVPGHKEVERGTSGTTLRFGGQRRRVRSSLAALGLEVPRLHAADRTLEETYDRSVADLASLRLRGFGPQGELPGAGAPWFMTIFGRDTLITSLQTLLFGPELATGTLRALAALQATGDHPEVDAEPGKIPHEVRRGKAAISWFPIYYGSIDSTPLFLVLLSETWRWTGDDALVRELWDAALQALAWIDDSGDRDGDGFVEYERRTRRGLENQSWKDSGDSQPFRDGRHAEPPVAPVEVQGYVFDAKLRLAELAREVIADDALADRLEREAAELRTRFDGAFWMPDRGAYALALDRDKRQVDAVGSNIGHLLWSGIVPPERVPSIVETLVSPRMWTGWGIRTLAADEVAYNPISYHNGTVWPHDTSLAAWGLLRCGAVDESALLCRGVLDAAQSFAGSLPEVFAGFDRAETAFAVGYPTACNPQAWAAGAPVLCLRLLLGLEPSATEPFLQSGLTRAQDWLGDLTLEGIRARGRRFGVTVADGRIGVDPLE